MCALEGGEDVELKDLQPCGDGWVTNSLLVHTRYLAAKVARAHAQLLAEGMRMMIRDAVAPSGRLRGGTGVRGLGARVAGWRWAIENLGSKEVKSGTKLESTRLISTARPPGLETRVQLFYLDLLEATLAMDALAGSWSEDLLEASFYWLTEANRKVSLMIDEFASFLKSTLYAIFLLHCLRPIQPPSAPPSSIQYRTTHYLLSLLGQIRIFAPSLTMWLGNTTRHLVEKTISMVPKSAFKGATEEGPGDFRPILGLLEPGVGPMFERWADLAGRTHPQAPEVLRRSDLVPLRLPIPSIPQPPQDQGESKEGEEDEDA